GALAGSEHRHGAAAARAGPDLSLVGKCDVAPVRRQARLDRPNGPGQLRRPLDRFVAARPEQHGEEDEHGSEDGDQAAVHGTSLREGEGHPTPPGRQRPRAVREKRTAETCRRRGTGMISRRSFLTAAGAGFGAALTADQPKGPRKKLAIVTTE